MQTTMESPSTHHELHRPSHPYSNRKILIIVVLDIAVLYVVYSFVWSGNQTLYLNSNDTNINSKDDQIRSPFQHTLGFIRWNSAYRERIVLMEKYRPFFADLHYSMPGYASQLNYTADGWQASSHAYKAVGDTMQIILQNYSMIEGLLYFHFDAWINPFGFDDMDFRQVWFPDAVLPPFRCVNSTVGWSWWAWDGKYHDVAIAATRNVAKNYSGRFITAENVFCGGWSDIYYIPRRFFHDFIDLTNIFYGAGSFHEVAIPTMLNILDLTYRLTPFHSIITKVKDCWGDCCTNGASPDDIKQKRCGHRMDLGNENIRKSFIDLLDSEKIYLNKTISSKSQK